jgi:alkaline phosphatase D
METSRLFQKYSSRRAVLGAGALVAATVATPKAAAARVARFSTDPFTLGIASGDPEPDGFVLWTRLAPEPLAPDGLGGMPPLDIPVLWQVSDDPNFGRIAKAGVAFARPEFAHALHVEVRGLQPGREYWYRFRCARYLSQVGRTVTSPAPYEMPSALLMAAVSCSNFEHGWFTAYRRLAEDYPDVILHLGDYQYEYPKDTYVASSGNVRTHEGPETQTLENYRQRYAQYKTDPDLQLAHAAAPWVVVYDDHEVDNNYAGQIPEKPEENFGARITAAYRAYYENMPLRITSIPSGPGMQLYRRVRWGRLAMFHMLDTRQYRDDQVCGDGFQTDCVGAQDPTRTLTGAQQEQWLLDGFRESEATWDLLGQQVFFAQRDSDAGPAKRMSTDAWDGYVPARQRVIAGWLEAGVRNPVVLTGDVHAHWAADLKQDFDNPDDPIVGSELVCSSITSGGDGADAPSNAHPWQPWNPHLRFQNRLRGYIRTTITAEQLTADFRSLPSVSTPDAPAFTRATLALNNGQRGLQFVADNPLPAAAGLSRVGRDKLRNTINWETERP